MALLFPRMRAHLVLGANTDVGKTVFGTGLVLASAALPLGAAVRKRRSFDPPADPEFVSYLKPVSTGPDADADASRVHAFAPHVQTRTLLQFRDPVSPHLAAQRMSDSDALPPGAQDSDLVRGVRAWLQERNAAAQGRQAAAFIETAGGVHSPVPSGASQLDVFRPLRLPVVLVGSSALGGISATRAAFEAVRMRGYDVDAVLLFPSPEYQTDQYLAQWFANEHGIPVWTLGGPRHANEPPELWGAPPPPAATLEEDHRIMTEYYRGLVFGAPHDARISSMTDVVAYLRRRHTERIKSLDSLAARTRAHCWWPFTQHNRVKSDADVTVIDSAYGDDFAVRRPPSHREVLGPVLDGSASWWTQGVGHAHPRLVQAAAYAAGPYGHVMFPACANEPSTRLAEQLLGTDGSRVAPGQGWASRVFFSDDGSTAVEVALKMAIESTVRRYSPSHLRSEAARSKAATGARPGSLGGRPERMPEVLGLEGSYHGDTIGAMDACEPNTYNAEVSWYEGRGYWLAPPTLRMRHGRITIATRGTYDWGAEGGELHLGEFATMHDVYDVETRLQHDPLAARYRAMLRKTLERLVIVECRRFGALLLEPLVMGAGGMVFVDPLFQRCLVDVVRESEDLFSMADPPLRDARSATHTAPRPATQRDPHTWQGLPVVFDEVFTGLYRLASPSAASVLGTTPDVACYAKILTGGLVPMAVTLASSSIFDTFAQSDDKASALLHGHSYTAHPIGCAVASETLSMLTELSESPQWLQHRLDWSPHANEELCSTAAWSLWSREAVLHLSHSPQVTSALALGTLLKLELATDQAGYTSSTADALIREVGQLEGEDAMFLRPLGNVLYVLCSVNSAPERLERIVEVLKQRLC